MPCNDLDKRNVAVDDINVQWFAMRATYHRELVAKSLLETAGIECYVPTVQKLKQANGRKVRVVAPLVSSLVFVHCFKEKLQQFKAKVPFLQFLTRRENGKNVPIVVPQNQMDNFIAVTGSDIIQALFFKPGELDVKRGTQVKLHGGTFDGLEGTLMKVTGKRNRRVVIEVKDVIAVAVECSDAQFVEVLKS